MNDPGMRRETSGRLTGGPAGCLIPPMGRPLNRGRLGRLRLTRRQVLAIVALASLLAAAAAALFRETGQDFRKYHNGQFAVVKTVDGDTIEIEPADGDRKHTTIRLWGVDTPETVDPRQKGPAYFGKEASAFTKQLTAGQTVRLELIAEDTRDKYGRLLAYVFLPDGSMLNERLIETGHGYADTRFEHPRMQRFIKLEERARKAKAGLWAGVRLEQMPEWRQRAERKDEPED